MSWNDYSDVTFNEGTGPSHPWIQWVNDGNYLDPRQKAGGFFQALDQAEFLDAAIPGPTATLVHRNGEQTPGVYSPELQVAVLTRRFGWKNKDTGEFAGPGKRPGTGWTGKTQYLSLIRDQGGEVVGPVILTFSGWAGSFFGEAWKAHQEAVKAAGAPAWLFFGTYRAGETKMMGDKAKSPVTDVEYVEAEEFEPDAAYIGDEAAGLVKGLAEEIRAWKEAWRDDGNGSDNGSGAGATGPQWGLIRKLFEQLGVGDRAKQDANLTEKGYDPEALSKEQASQVIERLQAAIDKAKEEEIPF